MRLGLSIAYVAVYLKTTKNTLFILGMLSESRNSEKPLEFKRTVIEMNC